LGERARERGKRSGVCKEVPSPLGERIRERGSKNLKKIPSPSLGERARERGKRSRVCKESSLSPWGEG